MIRVGKQTPSLDGMNGKVSLQGGLDIGDEKENVDLFANDLPQD